MSRNWIRDCSLVVSGAGLNLEFSVLRIRFTITQSTLQAPNMACFRVYNLSRATFQKVQAAGEGAKVQFQAGYVGNVGLVFSGTIKQTIYGKENAKDTYVDIFCADGDQGYNQARVTQTLAAGYTPQDVVNTAVASLAKFGMSFGYTDVDLSLPKYPRGTPLTGMARDHIRSVAISKQATWFVQDGKLNILSKDGSLPGGNFNLNSATGMVGIPKQTQDGVVVTSLLNPQIKNGCNLIIDQKDIVAAEQNNNPLDPNQNASNFNLGLTGLADGIYRVIYLERQGDTRGGEWYDTCTCVGAKTGNVNAAKTNLGLT